MVMAVDCLPCQQTDLYVQVQSLGKKLRYRQQNFFNSEGTSSSNCLFKELGWLKWLVLIYWTIVRNFTQLMNQDLHSHEINHSGFFPLLQSLHLLSSLNSVVLYLLGSSIILQWAAIPSFTEQLIATLIFMTLPFDIRYVVLCWFLQVIIWRACPTTKKQGK